MATKTKPSYILSVSGLVMNKACELKCLEVFTNGADAVIIDIYDVPDTNTTRSEENQSGYWYVAGADRVGGREWLYPRKLSFGCYVEITGTGGKAIVDFV